MVLMACMSSSVLHSVYSTNTKSSLSAVFTTNRNYNDKINVTRLRRKSINGAETQTLNEIAYEILKHELLAN